MIIIPVVAVMLAVLIGGGILIFKELNKKNDEKSKKDVENVTETSILDDDKDSKDNTEEVSETSDINEEITEILESEVVDADIQNLDNTIPNEMDRAYSAYLNFLVNNKTPFSDAYYWFNSYHGFVSDSYYDWSGSTVCLYDITSDGVPELIAILADKANYDNYGSYNPVLGFYTYNQATDEVEALYVFNMNIKSDVFFSLYTMPGNKLVLFEAPGTTYYGSNFTTEFEYTGSEIVISKAMYEIGTDLEADRVIDGVRYDYSTFEQYKVDYFNSLVFEDVLMFNIVTSFNGPGVYEKTPSNKPKALLFEEMVDYLNFRLGTTSIPDGTYEIYIDSRFSFEENDYSYLAFYALDHFEMTDEQVQSIKIGDYIDLSAWKIGVRDGFGITVTGDYNGVLDLKYDAEWDEYWLSLNSSEYKHLVKRSGDTNWTLLTICNSEVYRDVGAFKIKISDNVVITDYTCAEEEGKENGLITNSFADTDFYKYCHWATGKATIQNNEVIAVLLFY